MHNLMLSAVSGPDTSLSSRARIHSHTHTSVPAVDQLPPVPSRFYTDKRCQRRVGVKVEDGVSDWV